MHCPFVNLPEKRTGRYGAGITAAEMKHCHWVEPQMVCQIKFSEWTRDEKLRQPVFLGLREDKDAPRSSVKKPLMGEKITTRNQREEIVDVSNLDKVFYPKTGFTKGHVIDYYIKISPLLAAAFEGPSHLPEALPQRRRRVFLLRKTMPSTSARMGENHQCSAQRWQ